MGLTLMLFKHEGYFLKHIWVIVGMWFESCGPFALFCLPLTPEPWPLVAPSSSSSAPPTPRQLSSHCQFYFYVLCFFRFVFVFIYVFPCCSWDGFAWLPLRFIWSPQAVVFFLCVPSFHHPRPLTFLFF